MKEEALETGQNWVLLPIGANNEPVRVHARWLLERCGCDTCIEPNSRQPHRSAAHPARAGAAIVERCVKMN